MTLGVFSTLRTQSLSVAFLFSAVFLSGIQGVRGQYQMFDTTNAPPNGGNLLDHLVDPVSQQSNPMDKLDKSIDVMMGRSIDAYNQLATQQVVGKFSGPPVAGAGTPLNTAVELGSSLTGLEGPLTVEEVVSDINRSLAPIGTDVAMYSPRLSIDFQDFPRVHDSAVKLDANLDALTRHLENRLALTGRIELVQEDTEIVLRGTVDSSRQYRLTEMVARTTPGVNRLRNELTIEPPVRSTPARSTPELIPSRKLPRPRPSSPR